MNKVTVVTSFSGEGYVKYGRRFLETFKTYWPKDVKLRAYYHDFEMPHDALKAPNISYWNLLKTQPYVEEFRKKFPQAIGKTPDGKYNFRMDAQKFAHKMFAIFDSATKVKSGVLVWLDGDVFTKAKVTKKFLESVTDAPIVHLGRKATNYSETSFLSFDMKSTQALDMLADFRSLYLTGEIFGYQEWHDGFLFERLLNLHKNHGLVSKNLTPECTDLSAFAISPLAPLMEHLKGNLKDAVPQQIQDPTAPHPIKILPKNAVADEVILRNVDDNRKIITQYIKRCEPHGRRALVVSGGPTAKDNIDLIREMAEDEHTTLFCVKHSHNLLLEAGLLPKFCVLLDPRPYDGISTHNMKRSELIAKPDPRIHYLTATMVDPFVPKHLISNGCTPLGWHAWTNTVAGIQLPEGQFFVTGGTCAAVRTIALAHTMGFRKFELFGYDASWPTQPDLTEKDEIGRQKYFMASGGGAGGKPRWTTGELLSLAQDIEELFKSSEQMDLCLNLHGDSLLGDLFKLFNLPKRNLYDGWVSTVV